MTNEESAGPPEVMDPGSLEDSDTNDVPPSSVPAHQDSPDTAQSSGVDARATRETGPSPFNESEETPKQPTTIYLDDLKLTQQYIDAL